MRKQGWLIAILKSDSAKPSDHPGINLYIRKDSDSKNNIELFQKSKEEVDECFSDAVGQQREARRKKSQKLMRVLGQANWTSTAGENLLLTSRVRDSVQFRLAHGAHPVGGEMSVTVGDQQVFPAFFSAKNGPLEFTASQVACHQLDRVLGFYKTTPLVERVLSRSVLFALYFFKFYQSVLLI